MVGPPSRGIGRVFGRARIEEAGPSPLPELAAFFEVSLDHKVIRDSDFSIQKENEAWEKTQGWSRAELEGAPMIDFIHPDDRPASQGHMRRLETEEEVSGFINRYRRRDGGYVSLEWRARRGGDLTY